MRDNTAGHVSKEEGRHLCAALQAALGSDQFEFHAGVGYRNLMVWRGGDVVVCTPPHDILDQPVQLLPARRRRRRGRVVLGGAPDVLAGAVRSGAGAAAARHERVVLGRRQGAQHAALRRACTA